MRCPAAKIGYVFGPAYGPSEHVDGCLPVNGILLFV